MGVAAIVIGLITGAWVVASVVFIVAIIGWIAFALRDVIQRRRAA